METKLFSPLLIAANNIVKTKVPLSKRAKDYNTFIEWMGTNNKEIQKIKLPDKKKLKDLSLGGGLDGIGGGLDGIGGGGGGGGGIIGSILGGLGIGGGLRLIGGKIGGGLKSFYSFGRNAASKIFPKVAEKGVEKIAQKGIEKGAIKGFEHIALPGTTRAAEKAAQTAAMRGGTELATKGGGLAAKLIPGLATAVNLGTSAYRFTQGDVVGGSLSAISAIPIIGWAAVGIDVAREFGAFEGTPLARKEEKPKTKIEARLKEQEKKQREAASKSNVTFASITNKFDKVVSKFEKIKFGEKKKTKGGGGSGSGSGAPAAAGDAGDAGSTGAAGATAAAPAAPAAAPAGETAASFATRQIEKSKQSVGTGFEGERKLVTNKNLQKVGGENVGSKYSYDGYGNIYATDGNNIRVLGKEEIKTGIPGKFGNFNFFRNLNSGVVNLATHGDAKKSGWYDYAANAVVDSAPKGRVGMIDDWVSVKNSTRYKSQFTEATPYGKPTISAASGANVINPVPSQNIGSNKGGYAQDTGLDILTPVGSRVVSPVSGILEYAERGHVRQMGQDANPDMPGMQDQHSIRIKLDKPFKYAGKQVNYFYATHLYEIASALRNKSNIRINAGDLLGKSGVANNTPHVHVGFVEDREQTKFLDYKEVKNLLSGSTNLDNDAIQAAARGAQPLAPAQPPAAAQSSAVQNLQSYRPPAQSRGITVVPIMMGNQQQQIAAQPSVIPVPIPISGGGDGGGVVVVSPSEGQILNSLWKTMLLTNLSSA